jgi:hypothetical protein
MKAIPIFFFCLFVLLAAYACYLVIKKSGAIAAYLGFSWLPLALGIAWMSLELSLASLNPVLPILIVSLSLLLSVIGLPFMLTKYRRQLSTSKIIGMAAAALLYGIPAFLYVTLSITGTR